MAETDQAFAERIRNPAKSHKEVYDQRQEAAHRIDRLTLALAASEAEKETYRARWLSCLTPEEAERLRAALSVSERERDEAYRQNPILREQVRELQERLAVLDEAYRAVTEQLSRSATLAATAEVERDALREQLARAISRLREIAGDMSQPMETFAPVEQEMARDFIQKHDEAPR